MLETKQHAYNEKPGTSDLLNYKRYSLYPSSVQHVKKSHRNKNHIAVSINSL